MKARYCSASAQHGNLVQVDLLPTREFEQQVERPLEAVDVDDEALVLARVAREALAGIEALRLEEGHRHIRLRPARGARGVSALQAVVASTRSSIATASTGSNAGAAPRIAARARSTRAAQAPATTGAAAATASASLMSPLQCSAMSTPAANSPSAFSRNEPGSAFIDRVVGKQQPVEADRAADDVADDCRRDRRGMVGIERGVDDMRRHRRRQVAIGDEGREVGRLQRGAGRVDHGEREMAVGAGAAVAGEMLHHGKHAGLQHAVGGGAAEPGDGGRIARVGAVADHVVRALDRHVEDGEAVDVDADHAADPRR